jgi:predicted amidohydrolase YtcJ
VVNGGAHSLGLRVLASQPEWAVHIVFTPAQADWPQLRPQLQALDAALPRGPVL